MAVYSVGRTSAEWGTGLMATRLREWPDEQVGSGPAQLHNNTALPWPLTNHIYIYSFVFLINHTFHLNYTSLHSHQKHNHTNIHKDSPFRSRLILSSKHTQTKTNMCFQQWYSCFNCKNLEMGKKEDCGGGWKNCTVHNETHTVMSCSRCAGGGGR